MATTQRTRAATGLAIAASLLASHATADRAEWRDWPVGDRFGLEIAAFHVESDTNLKADIQGYEGIQLNINMEDVMDVDSSVWTPNVYAYWRMTERNTLRYSYFNLDRDGRNSIDLPLGTIGGIPFGPDIETTLDLESHMITWNYSFVFDETRDFYAGLGLALYSVDLSLVDKEGFLDPLKENLEAPVPAITVGYDWAFHPKWVWRNTANFLALNLDLKGDEYEGNVVGISTSVEWRAFSHVSFTAGYDFQWINVNSADDDYRYELDFTLNGPRLGAMMRF